MVASEWVPTEHSQWDQAPPNESIMVVEDEGIVAQDLGECLKALGYRVPAIVGTGRDAIAGAEEHQPDLILMDIMLRGDMRGTRAAHLIREKLNIPIIFLTAYSDQDTLHEARITEPYGYLLKPFEESELRATISIALYKNKMDRRAREQRDWLDTVLNSLAEALITTDRIGRITYMNSIAEGLTGWDLPQARTRSLNEIFYLVDADTGHPIDSAVADPFSSRSTNTALISRNGQTIRVHHNASPFNGPDGIHNGYVVTFGVQT